MFDEPLSKGSRLPESPRINSLLAGLMGGPKASAQAQTPTPTPTPTPALATQELLEPAPAPKSITARPFSTFLKSVQWAYVPTTGSLVVATPGMPVREFFSMVNWSGDRSPSSPSFGGSIAPPSVENLMSQFSWD